MVYALAAYTLTAVSLGIYGVLTAHRARAGEATLLGTTSAQYAQTLNLGAALLAPFWLWGHGQKVLGVAVLGLWLGVVPLARLLPEVSAGFLALVPLAASAALGWMGNRIAIAYRGVEGGERYSASQLPWSLAGVTLAFGVLPWLLYGAGLLD